jgi:hypothetical protein
MMDRHEIFLYMFDCLPMFLALVIFHITHPGRIMTGPDSYWPKLTKEEKKAKKAGKKKSEGGEEKRKDRIEENEAGRGRIQWWLLKLLYEGGEIEALTEDGR